MRCVQGLVPAASSASAAAGRGQTFDDEEEEEEEVGGGGGVLSFFPPTCVKADGCRGDGFRGRGNGAGLHAYTTYIQCIVNSKCYTCSHFQSNKNVVYALSYIATTTTTTTIITITIIVMHP